VLKPGAAKKVSIYVGEDEQYQSNPRYAAILDFLFYRGVSGATVTRGIAGFGADHQMHTSRILRLAENLPIKIEFVETAEKLEEILPKLEEMVPAGLIEVQDTTILKPSQAAAQPAAPTAARMPSDHLRREDRAKMLRIYIAESDRWRDKPLYQALVESCRANDIAGATVYRGFMGYGASRVIRRENPLGLTHDRPVMVAVVETEEKLRAMQPVLDDMIGEGLIAISDVDIIKYSHRPPKAGGKEGAS